jgi:N-acetylglutamate synthase-like GNAT family acetyltransferase
VDPTGDVRDAELSDGPAIADLLAELGYPAEPNRVAERLTRLQADSHSRVIVAVTEGRVVGVVAIHAMQPLEHDEQWCELIALVVTEPYRGRGIGTMLVAAAETEARARACAGMVLGSGVWRPNAHEFYRSLGYEQTGARFKKLLED